VKKNLLFVAAALALAACGGDEHSDLKQELGQLTKDFRGRVDPLPQVKPYEPVPYTAEGQIDPFRPQRIDVAQRKLSPSASNSRLEKERDRPKEPLEAFPLESIQMMGTITQDRRPLPSSRRDPIFTGCARATTWARTSASSPGSTRARSPSRN
jgi:type IV pilus assembly protein PilP